MKPYHHLTCQRSLIPDLTAEAKRLQLTNPGLVRAMLEAWLTADLADREAAADIAREAGPWAYWTMIMPDDMIAVEVAASGVDLEARHVAAALWDVWRTVPKPTRARLAAPHRVRVRGGWTKSLQVLQLLCTAPATLSEIASAIYGEATNATTNRVSVMLDRLRARKHVTGGHHGAWSVTDVGRAVLENATKREEPENLSET